MTVFKKSILLPLFLFLVFLPVSSFAAPVSATRNPNDPTSQRDFTADEISQIKEMLFGKPLKPYSVNVYGLLQANVNFLDSTRDNVPDFTVTHARFGLFAIEKNWSGKLEMEFNGNQPQKEFPALVDRPLLISESASNTAGVRQAQINFDFLRFVVENGHKKTRIVRVNAPDAVSDEPAVVADAEIAAQQKTQAESRSKKEVTTVTKKVNPDEPQSASALSDTLKTDTALVSRLSLGGIRVGGASAVSTDITYTPSGFARQDGVYLAENAAFGENLVGTLGFGIFNNLSTTTPGASGDFQGWGAYKGTAPNFLGILGITSPTMTKGYVFNTNWSYNFTKTSNISAVLFYGFQTNAAANTNGNGFATTTRSVEHIEASLLYNDSKMFGSEALVTGNGLSLWFEAELGDNQKRTNAGKDIVFIKSLNDGYKAYLYGIGFGGDTHDYFSNLLFDADRLLYAVTATYVDSHFIDASYSKPYNVTQFAAQVGYGYRTLEFNLVGAYAFSDSTSFADFKLDEPILSRDFKRPNQFTLYLTASLYF